MAACNSTNIDLSYCRLGHDPYFLQPTKQIRSLVIDGSIFSEPYIPVLTVSWLLAFFCYMQNYPWWICNEHPIRSLSKLITPLHRFGYSGHEADIRNHIWSQAETIATSSTAGIYDQVLYPNHLSFPEIFHSGVYNAIFPNDELLFLCGPDILRKYCKYLFELKYCGVTNKPKEVWNFLSDDLATHGNEWLQIIRKSPYVILSRGTMVSPKQIMHFQLNLVHSRCDDFKELMLRNPRVQVNILTLRASLLGVNTLPAYMRRNRRPCIALTLRGQSHNDWRIQCNTCCFTIFVQNLLAIAAYKNLGLVIMDGGDNEAIGNIFRGQNVVAIKDARYHHDPSTRKRVFPDWVDHPTGGNAFIQQLSFV